MSVLPALISFLGLRMVSIVYKQSVYEYFQRKHFFQAHAILSAMVVRGLGLLVVLVRPDLQPYLVDLRVIDNWIKYIFWVLLVYKYFTVPVRYTIDITYIYTLLNASN